MKTLLIFPPQWTPMNPHFSIATLVGQLRKNNYEVKIRDLNIEFYRKVLTKEYLQKSIDKAFALQEYLFESLLKEYTDDKIEADYSEDFKKELVRYTKIKEFKEKRMYEVENIPEAIEESVSIMTCKEKFYEPELLIETLNNIDKALELASLPYYPALLEFHNYSNPFFKLTFDSIKEHCLDRSTNMFYDYYEEMIQSIIDENADLIGISVNSSTQIIPGLTLAMMLKQRTNAHINIGGNFFGRVVEELSGKPEFFEMFCDSLIIEEGEKPIVELAKCLEGKIGMDKVPNLIYLDNGIVKVNEKTVPLKLNELHCQDLDGFPLDLYLTPDIVLSIQSSRGCYWQKCSFCDHYFGQNVNVKDIDILINEIKEVQRKYNISYFEFVDESISPGYLKLMSTRIMQEGLEINWFNNARLETEFTKELLQNANDAGLRMVLWGVESGSDRIMQLINKGINLDKRFDVLRDSIDSGIWNFAFIFFGFPTETYEDALKTIEMICNNTDIICCYGKSIFTLGKHTRLRDDPDKFGITDIVKNQDEFSPSYEFKTSSGLTPKEVNQVAGLCTEKCNEAYGNPLWMYIRYREVLFLYVSKYGAKAVQDCKIA
ncbi:MAG: hypothetical protein A2104_07525 [Candidatus Melainabacteria bacterium GWF2_32_7]|nr:MAG: hypothetical protein A2104_07525 [Candidatus Melainabacteria bacterium GWF2_32_7]